MINSGGEVQVKVDYKSTNNGNQLMPKFGFRVAIPKQYTQIEGYSRGPQENYPDRKTGAFICTYHSTINDFITPYISLQDNSNRCDIRYAKFTNEAGDGFVTRGIQAFSFRAWSYLESGLESAKHGYRIHGVGGNDSWSARTHKKYTIDGNQSISFGFIISPIL